MSTVDARTDTAATAGAAGPEWTATKQQLLERRLARRGRGAVETGVPRLPEGAPLPLSYAQERLWFMEQLAPGTAAYTIPLVLRLRGPLDVDALQAALTAVTIRHEVLRTTFPATDDGRPAVVVTPPAPVPLAIREVTAADGGPAPEDAEARLARVEEVVRDEAEHPFDLATGPVLRATLLRVDDEDHVLLVVVHHIAADGWSTDVLVGDLTAAYRARVAAGPPPPAGSSPVDGAAPAADGGPVTDGARAVDGESPAAASADGAGPLCGLADPAVRYVDHAAWQRERVSGPAGATHLAYWREALAGVPPLELPTDHPRPTEQAFRGATHHARIDRELVDAVAALGRAHGATLYMTLLAAYQVLLARYSGQDDFAVGSPIAGRTRPEVEGLVGMFTNVLALRADLSDDPTFATLVDRTRASALAAFTHQEVPFEQVVNVLGLARDVSRPPVFQATLAMQNYARTGSHDAGAAGAGELDIAWFALEPDTTRFDLELFVFEVPEGLNLVLVYGTALFTEPTVARLCDHLRTLLAAAVATPDAPVSTLGLLAPGERDAVLRAAAGPVVEVPGPATVHGLVEAQAARTPDLVAVSSEDGSLTYGALDAAANRVAHGLRAAGVGRGDRVGVCAERSPDLVVALLGVLKAGAAYVPLDPAYPADRLAFMLADAAVAAVLTQAPLRDRATPPDVPVLLLDDPTTWSDQPSTPPDAPVGPDDAAYVIYTSGSTGRPKGVVNAHRGVVNRLDWTQRTYGLGADDVVLQKTPAGFDVSVWEFFWPLLAGARLVLARPDGHRDAAYLREVIAAEGVTTAHFVPSMLAVFLAEGVDDAGPDTGDGYGAAGPGAGCASLRRVLCSGEELPADLARRFVAALPWCGLHNLYGPTEAAVDVSAFACLPDALDGVPRVPIGTPVQNTTLHVLDDRLTPVPVGVRGQLHIGGVQVARGYLGRPGLTADRFVPDPFGPPGARLYRTGDAARRRPDGTLEFLGRLDSQVKLRGLRIELGEIEAGLRARPDVRDAVVVVREDTPGDPRLAAYLVGARAAAGAAADAAGAGDAVDVEAARQALRDALPDYMVPSAFVVLDALPTTPNGKLDRAALPAPEFTRDASTEFVAPSTPTEQAVAEVWQVVLGVEQIGVDDDFFDLGGHSLLATQVVARLRKAMDGAGRPVSVMDTFKHRTVRTLAAHVDRPVDDDEPRLLLHELTRPRPGRKPTLSFVCVPYGGGSAVVYQPLADALPAGYALHAVAIPGHDVGLSEQPMPFDDIVEYCAEEILRTVQGPLALYGHCGVGGALTVALARRLELAGRRLEAVYIGAIFPFARPRGLLHLLSRIATLESLRSNQTYANWLTSMGVDMDGIDPDQAKQIITNMRHDTQSAEEYFTTLLDGEISRLRAPVVSVVGDQDPATEFYEERYREWHFLTESAAAVVLADAGHFFLKYRADELAEIVTTTHVAVVEGRTAELAASARGDDPSWWLHEHAASDGASGPGSDAGTGGASSGRGTDAPGGGTDAGPGGGAAPPPPAGRRTRPRGARGARPAVRPSMRRFGVVAVGQMVSITGSALTSFAIPIFIYLQTGSIARFGLFAVLGLVPGLLVSPLAGAVVDRVSRRRVMLAGDAGAFVTQSVLGALLWTGSLALWHLYVLIIALSVSLAFQRLAYAASVPQLVPKRFLGHATGVTQLVTGTATFLVPLVAVGLMATIGLRGIVVIDVVSYAFAIVVLLFVRFPSTMGWRPRESLGAEIANGFRYSWGKRSFRAMLLYFALLNVFLGPLLLLVSPLVLSFATLSEVGRVSFVSGLGAIVGGLAMSAWGGPARHRMRGVFVFTLVLAVFALVTGVRANLWVIAVGVFGISVGLTLVNSIYTTVIQVKVPQRYHGRVFALNTMIAWSTLPLGFGVVGPLAAKLLDPLLLPGGALASTVGRVIGVGEGRGIGLAYVVFALGMVVLVAIAARTRTLSRFDDEVPDAVADDLVGAQERQRRRESVAA